MVSMEQEGQKAPEAIVMDLVMVFGDGKYAQKQFGETPEEGTYKLMSDKKPKAVDFVITKGPDKGKTQHAIYQLDGDDLKVCLTQAGSAKCPTTFDAKAGSGQMLSVLKRKK